jgi:hypothetical protein
MGPDRHSDSASVLQQVNDSLLKSQILPVLMIPVTNPSFLDRQYSMTSSLSGYYPYVPASGLFFAIEPHVQKT